MPPAPGLAGATLRQVVHTSIGGASLRVRLSNLFGDGPLAVTAVHVARSRGGSVIEVASDRRLTFAGADSVRLAPGTAATSDPLDFAVPEIVVHASGETRRLYLVPGGFVEFDSEDSMNLEGSLERIDGNA